VVEHPPPHGGPRHRRRVGRRGKDVGDVDGAEAGVDRGVLLQVGGQPEQPSVGSDPHPDWWHPSQAAHLTLRVTVDGQHVATRCGHQASYIVCLEHVVAHDDQAPVVVDLLEAGQHRGRRALLPVRVDHQLDREAVGVDGRGHVLAPVAGHDHDPGHSCLAQHLDCAVEQGHSAHPPQHCRQE
jgi:hypothetical protein